MQCVILAGGRGTRIASVARDVPKALIPVAGHPFAHHQLGLLARGGVRRVVYSIGHLGDQIRRYVGDGGRWGLEVSYVDEGAALRGTGGALRLALDRGALADAFLVLYGDSYLPIDYPAVWRAFERASRPGLMTVFRNQDRWDRSNVLFERGRVVLYDKEHRDPRAARMEYVDYGLTVLTGAAVARHVETDAVVDLADVYHRMSEDGDLAGFEVDRRFYEIGSPEGLEDFRRLLMGEPAAGGAGS